MNKGLRLFLLAALPFLFFPVAALASAAGRAECRSMPSRILGRPVAYCVLLPPSFDVEKARRYPVLYFLHGLGENEQTLVNFGGMNLVEDLREQGEVGEFIIATADGDSSFYINSRDGRQRYEDFFVQEFMPFIETMYRGREGRKYRGIGGVSMGGYGALRLAFRYPQKFGSVSAHSAALLEKLPAATIADSRAAARTRILGGVFGSPPDREFWERNSPFTLARNGARLAGLKIYFDCGMEDDYGFNAGAQELHDLLKSRGIPHEFHLYPGGHNWSYVAEHLGASFEFHSRAFGLTAAAK
jgi:S-formylglutathione hydrolase FrmB